MNQDEIKIIEVDSSYFGKEYFADRPDCERLINKRLDDLGLNIMRDWRVGLEEYIRNYYCTYRTGYSLFIKFYSHSTSSRMIFKMFII